MACNEEESGKHKCECYWADNDAEDKCYGPYTVKLLKARRMCNDFNLRTMELTYINSAGESSTSNSPSVLTSMIISDFND